MVLSITFGSLFFWGAIPERGSFDVNGAISWSDSLAFFGAHRKCGSLVRYGSIEVRGSLATNVLFGGLGSLVVNGAIRLLVHSHWMDQSRGSIHSWCTVQSK